MTSSFLGSPLALGALGKKTSLVPGISLFVCFAKTLKEKHLLPLSAIHKTLDET